MRERKLPAMDGVIEPCADECHGPFKQKSQIVASGWDEARPSRGRGKGLWRVGLRVVRVSGRLANRRSRVMQIGKTQ